MQGVVVGLEAALYLALMPGKRDIAAYVQKSKPLELIG